MRIILFLLDKLSCHGGSGYCLKSFRRQRLHDQQWPKLHITAYFLRCIWLYGQLDLTSSFKVDGKAWIRRSGY